MAQLEEGYTRISNEILESLSRSNLNSSQMKIILYIIRYTYGFKEKLMFRKYETISKDLGMPIDTVKRTMSQLFKANILYKEGSKYGFQKYSKDWQSVKNDTDKKCQKRHRKVSKMTPQSVKNDTDYIKKETIKETIKENSIYTTTSGLSFKGISLSESFLKDKQTAYPQLDIMQEARSCIDYHLTNKTGKKNWERTFTNWCLNAIKFQNERKQKERQSNDRYIAPL